MCRDNNREFIKLDMVSQQFHGKGSKNEMLKTSNISNHSFFTQYRGSKENFFQSFQDELKWIEKFIINQEKKNFFNEIYTENKPIFEFYDIDLKSNQFVSSETVFRTFFKIYSNFCGKFGMPCQSKHLRVLDASKGSKISLHIINRKRVFKTPSSLRTFYDNFKEWTTKNYPENINMFDWGVVKPKGGALRMIYASKPGENRPFLPASFHSYSYGDANISNFFITNPDSLNYFNVKKQPIKKVKKIIKTIDNDKDCNIDSFVRTKLFNAFEIGTPDEQGFITLKRTKSCPCFFNKKRIHNKRDSWIRLVEGNIYYGCFCDESVTTLIQKECNQIPDSIKVCKQNIGSYLEHLNKFDVVCIKSNMMTHKTRNLERLFTLYPRILMISFRTSLKNEYMTDFAKYGFEDYSTFKGKEILANRLVVQIDSLHKVRGYFDLVILDEIEYSISHFFSFVKNKVHVYNALEQYITKSKKIIALDALLTSETVDWLKSFNRNVGTIENTFKSFKGKKAIIHTKGSKSVSGQFIAYVKTKVKQGLNVVCPVNSRTVGEQLFAVLNDMNIKTGLITDRTTKIPSSDWDKYQVLIYSPTIVAGISFGEQGVEPHFDENISYFTNLSCEARLATQMLFRVRNIKSDTMHIFLNQCKSTMNLPTDSKELDKYIKNKVLDISNLHLKIDIISNKLVQDNYYKLYRYHLKELHQSRKFYLEKLSGCLLTQGVEIKVEQLEMDTIQESHEQYYDIITRMKNVQEDQILNARSLNWEEYENIKNRYEKSLDEQHSIHKYIIESTYNTTLTKPILSDISSKDNLMQFNNLCFLNTNWNNLKVLLREEIEGQLNTNDNKELLHLNKRYRKLYIVIQLLEHLKFESIHDKKIVLPDINSTISFLNTYESSIRSATGWKEQKFEIDHAHQAFQYIANMLSFCGLTLTRCGKKMSKRKLKIIEDYDKYGIKLKKSIFSNEI